MNAMTQHCKDVRRITKKIQCMAELNETETLEWREKFQRELILKSISEIRSLCDVMEARNK
jgi:hypothetical protein